MYYNSHIILEFLTYILFIYVIYHHCLVCYVLYLY